MKKQLNHIKTLCLLSALLLASCSEDTLQEFNIQPGSPTSVSSGTVIGDIIKTNTDLTIPVGLKLSNAASKAFEVTFEVDQEAAEAYISSSNLGATHVVASSGSLFLPNSTKVNFGSDATQFNIKITRTEVEQYFDKTIVIGYRITNAGKGNSIDPNNAKGVIVLKVSDLISTDDIHYLSLVNGAGQVLEAKNQVNYEGSSSGMSIPIGISLASFPGSTFFVDVETSTDTIASLIAQGILPANTVPLQTGKYTLPARVQVASNAKTANLNLDIPWSVINENIDNKLAIVVKLASSTLHVINPEKNYTILLIDSKNVVEVDVTGDRSNFFVNRDNNSGPNSNEGSLKLVDGNYGSKFLQSSFTGDLQCTLIFNTPQKIGAYTLTSGGDAKERDPNAWFLEGSNDGVNWTTVDTRSGVDFATRLLTKRFDIDIPQAFTQFRLNITSNVGNNLFQASEWRLVRFP
ncbi:discoidin domain-containing protein [Sphingobacterium sp. HJSM2_6]|uniref:discoidin domain-containing protein n=1 Tax=Sphingobacterium sp. HJSM2_6 TaxID=3366264 RepID=UPI003BC43147